MTAGFQGAVQRVLYFLWQMGAGVASYFRANDDSGYVVPGASDDVLISDLPCDQPLDQPLKRRRLEIPGPGQQTSFSRAHRDARRLLMCSSPAWTAQRDLQSEFLRRRCQAEGSKLKRLRGGGAAAGERPWCFLFQEVFKPFVKVEDRWWNACNFSYASFVDCSRKFLDSCGLSSAFEKFVVRGGGGARRERMKEDGEEMMARPLSAKESLKLAYRLAVLYEQETDWDLLNDGIGLEMAGDSLLICNWTNGLWKIDGGVGGGAYTYRARIDKIVQTFEDLAEFGIRPPSWGRDFVKHIFREGNGEADRLTHEAREGNVFRNLYPEHIWRAHVCDNFRCIGLRGSFDGGVCPQGVGAGWRLQIGYVPRFLDSTEPEHVAKRARVTSLFPHSSSPCPIFWETVGECATALPSDCSITDAELAGLEGLLKAAVEVAHYICELPSHPAAARLGRHSTSSGELGAWSASPKKTKVEGGVEGVGC